MVFDEFAHGAERVVELEMGWRGGRDVRMREWGGLRCNRWREMCYWDMVALGSGDDMKIGLYSRTLLEYSGQEELQTGDDSGIQRDRRRESRRALSGIVEPIMLACKLTVSLGGESSGAWMLQPFMHERCRKVEDVREIAAGRGDCISSSCIESAAGAGMEDPEPMAGTDTCGWRRGMRLEDGRDWLRRGCLV